MPSAAHLWGLGYTVARIPQDGFVTVFRYAPFRHWQGSIIHDESRFRVAQSPVYPVRLGRKVELHHLAPVVAVPAPLRAYGFSSSCLQVGDLQTHDGWQPSLCIDGIHRFWLADG